MPQIRLVEQRLAPHLLIAELMFASYHCLFVCEKKAAQYRNTGGVYKLLAYEKQI
jgi:hypothetical protein